MTRIVDLCEDILIIIFSKLNIQDKCSCAQVNKRWRQIFYEQILWRNTDIRLEYTKECPELVSSLAKRGIKKIRICRMRSPIRMLLTHVPTLETVSLCFCDGINDKNLARSFGGTPYPSIKSLNLSFCLDVGDIGVRNISSHMYNLEMLDLSECPRLSNSGLARLVKHLWKLRILNLSYCRDITDAGMLKIKQYCNNLEVLELRCLYKISAKGLKSLSEGEGLAKLRHLSLGPSHRINNQAIVYLAYGNLRLEHLELSDLNNLSDISLSHIANAMKTLKSLTLHLTLMTDVGIEYICSMTNLDRLKIISSKLVTDLGIQNITAKLSHLKLLSLNDCYITNVAVVHIANHMKNLEVLELTQCLQVSYEGLRPLSLSMQNLQKLNLEGTIKVYANSKLTLFDNLPKLKEVLYDRIDLNDWITDD